MQNDENEIGGSENKEAEIQVLEKNEVEINVIDKESLEKENQCKDCKLPIEPKAKKCHHCGSWQGKYSRIFKGMINFITIAMLGIAISQAVIGYSQYKESKNKRIEAEKVLKQAEQVLEEAITESEKIRNKAESTLSEASNALTTANNVSLETKDEANKVLTIAKDEANKVLSMARVELKTAIIETSEIKKTFGEASNEVKKNLEESNERISTAENEFFKQFNQLKSEMERDKEDFSAELAILKDRNYLVGLADEAIVAGDRESYEQLEEIAADENEPSYRQKMSMAEVNRIKSYYIAGSRTSSHEVKYTNIEDQKILKNDEIPKDKLIDALKNNKNWIVRGKSAELLANFKEIDVVNALLLSIKTEQRLDVLEESLSSFCRITGCKKYDILRSQHVIDWWGKNKEEVKSELSAKE